jgi:hypothetical protein
MDPLHATIPEFTAEGFTQVECYCPRCRVMRIRPISWLPRISMGLTYCTAFSATPLPIEVVLGQAVALGRGARQATGAEGVIQPANH